MSVSIDDIRAAAGRLAGKALRTPLLESPRLNDIAGARVLIKPECLQRTGSFKFRGAYNTLSSMDPDIRSRGVLAYSSGNHAQGVALAARMFNVPATIIMPQDAPAMKKRNTAEYGADVVLYDRYTESREELGERLTAERGLTLVKPYDQESVVAGQGTVGLEIGEQCDDAGVTPEIALCPAGGGGQVRRARRRLPPEQRPRLLGARGDRRARAGHARAADELARPAAAGRQCPATSACRPGVTSAKR